MSAEYQPFPFAEDLPDWGRQVDYADTCRADRPCPTLEEALSLTDCSVPTLGSLISSPRTMVVNGCGLIAVHRPADASHWYEGFGSPPVAAGLWGAADIGGAIWSATRSLDCERSEQVICSTCGDIYPTCNTLSGWLPEPPPLPPSGCSCESEGEDGARVSLDCFCSIYECPSYSAAVHDCDVEPNDRRLSLRRATEGCGQVWFESGAGRFGYDPNVGELVAAEASLDVPVVLPCYTYRVTAGAAVECAEPVDCSCNARDPVAPLGTGHELDRCEDARWFQAISGSVPD